MNDEWDGFVRIVIETSDAGPDAAEALRWVLEWAAKAADDAPFHVDHLHVEAIDRCEVADV